jgi:hypothetical protein
VLRSGLLNTYRDHGDDMGLRLCREYAWETGDVMAEVHGARKASEVLYGVADSIATRLPLCDLHADKPEPIAEVVAAPVPAKASVETIVWLVALALLSYAAGWSAHP